MARLVLFRLFIDVERERLRVAPCPHGQECLQSCDAPDSATVGKLSGVVGKKQKPVMVIPSAFDDSMSLTVASEPPDFGGLCDGDCVAVCAFQHVALPSRFALRVTPVAAHDVFRALLRGFVEVELHVEAAAVLVRPAGRNFRPDVLVEIATSSHDAVNLVAGRVALGLALRVRRQVCLGNVAHGRFLHHGVCAS